MTAVYHVADRSTEDSYALKLHRGGSDHDHLDDWARFEHEFYTLKEFSHPYIAQAYEYGFDHGNPFFTMELLNGGDLNDRSPLPWNTTCSLLRDICCSLSLLHSRRLIHRRIDLNSIRFNSSDQGKLISFNAVIPMGSSKQIIGTPPFTPPEVINYQILDARSDLYSLGSTAYYTLTGRNAYPAKSIADLPDLWRSKPTPPSYYIHDIPKELDDLVMSLLSLYPMARPKNTTEVFDRLGTILGIEETQGSITPHIYISTPTLVGRQNSILRIRKQMIRALRGRGGVFYIEGEAGVGRSRFLDACMLEGKLAGYTVVRADADDSKTGDYGVIRALGNRLIEALPVVALEKVQPYIADLSHVFPDIRSKLLKNLESSVFDRASIFPELRPQVQVSLRKWILEVCSKRTLMIAVDDFNGIDEPSASLLSVLSKYAFNHRLVLVTTVESGSLASAPDALNMLRQAGARIDLNNLDLNSCEHILQSLFGNTPCISSLKNQAFVLSQGNPRTITEYAQHLIIHKLIEYGEAKWNLLPLYYHSPPPSDLQTIIHRRTTLLSTDAYNVLQAYSLSPNDAYSLYECYSLIDTKEKEFAYKILYELIDNQLISSDGKSYFLTPIGQIAVQSITLERQAQINYQLRLASLFKKRGSDPLRTIKYQLLAGKDESAIDLLIEFLDHSRKHLTPLGIEPSSNFLRRITAYKNTLTTALQTCHKLKRSQRDQFILQQILTTLGIYTVSSDTHQYAEKVLEQLCKDSGLSIHQKDKDERKPASCLPTAISTTRQQYNVCENTERVLQPEQALDELIQHIMDMTSYAVTAQDIKLLDSIPSLSPFFHLSPSLRIFEEIKNGAQLSLCGFTEQSCQLFSFALDGMEESDLTSYSKKSMRVTRLGLIFALGMSEAGLGLSSALAHANMLEEDPLYQINAWRIRTAYHQFQGNIQQAKLCRKSVDLLHTQNSQSNLYECIHLILDITTYAEINDLAGVEQTISGIENKAKEFAGWIPWLHFAYAEYHRIRGDLDRALVEFDKVLLITEPGRHMVWPYAAGSQLNTLIYKGHVQEAKALGKERVAACQNAGLGIISGLVTIALATAEALLSEFDIAVSRISSVIHEAEQLGLKGFNLGVIYEYRALVAVWMQDQANLYHFAKLCSEQYKYSDNPLLITRYHKLMEEARQANISVSRRLIQAVKLLTTSSTDIGVNMELAFAYCKGFRERAQRGINLLVKSCHAAGGYLYTMQEEGPVLAAEYGKQTKPDGLDSMISDYLTAELAETSEVTMTSADYLSILGSQMDWTCDNGNQYRPILLSSATDEGIRITGVAALLKKANVELTINSDIVVALSNVLLNKGDVKTAKAAN